MRHNRLILTKLFTIVNHIKQDQKSVYLSDQQLTGPSLVNHNGFMPSKNRVKTYIENGYYHIYNRGVEKRDIFIDDQDYRVFLHFLKNYLSSPPKLLTHPVQEVTGSGPVRLRPFKTFFGEISLLAYCLMPNHFHFLIKQANKNSMTRFIQALCTSYSMYFNKKYKRIGTLFQGPYKAALVMEDSYLLHLSRYIHLNPTELLTGPGPARVPIKPGNYSYSSYPYYLGKKRAPWINPKPIISFFKSARRRNLRDFFSYQSFVEDYLEDPRELLGSLSID